MSTATLAPPVATTAVHAPIPMGRLTAVELRKMFDTRAGRWLVISIALTSIAASAAVIAWAPDDAITYNTFGSALGIPMNIVLPVIAVLSVTSEWSQRSGLTTFTLVPRRGRVLGAKALAVLVMGIVATCLAFVIGALGNVLGAALTGNEVVWDLDAGNLARIMLGMLLWMAAGFMLGLLLRSSPAAIVGYFVYTFVLPTLFELLAAYQGWFADLQPWVDITTTSNALFADAMTGEQWAQLGVTSLVWLIAPLAIGVVATLRSEVK